MEKMEMIKIEGSSQIESVGFWGEKLFVKFLRGGLYGYDGVPEEVFNDLLNAESKGKFFSANIKNVFPYKKLA